MIAVEARTLTVNLTTEAKPKFHYRQQLRLKRGTGRITGWHHVSEQTRQKFDDPENDAPDLGWHYWFEYDCPAYLQEPIELFSEARLLSAIG